MGVVVVYLGTRRGATRSQDERAAQRLESVRVAGLFRGRLFHQGTQGRLNSASYTAFLQQVLEQTTAPIYLIQDGARYHTSKATHVFFAAHADRLTVAQLPSYSPDYNPIEKLWKQVKQEDTHLVYFPTFEALRDKVETALLKFARRAEDILSLCGLPTALACAT